MSLTRRTVYLLACLLVGGICGVGAQVPQMIDYQGKIAVAGVNFSGEGQFKFSLVNGEGAETYWSHDGSGAGGSEPVTHVVRTVESGLYSIVLGDPAVLDSGGAAVRGIGAAVFGHAEVRLRIWFNDGVNGFQLLAPDRRIASVGYALMADTVADGSITTAKLAPGSVTADKLAAPIGGGGGGNLQASLSAADAGLLAAGYVKIQSVAAPEWEARSGVGAPSPRSNHTAVWTGEGMMVWGGRVGTTLSNQGGRYSPATGQWTLLPTSDVSPARTGHTAVWAGDRMIVWGGFTNDGESQSGAFYAPPGEDPELPAGEEPPLEPYQPTGGWMETGSTSAPDERSGHTAVWTGSEMLVWGGKNGDGVLGNGGAYVPPSGALVPGVDGSWSAMGSAGAPVARHGHTAVWTGSKMIVWGGLDVDFNALGDGGIYDPATDTWEVVATAGAPSPRGGHTAVWTGTEMVVFGGSSTELADSALNDGAAFDPDTGVWRALSGAGAPSARLQHGAVWTGGEMLVFGGEGADGETETSGAAYTLSSGAWRVLPEGGAASGGQTGVWSGAELLVFGAGGLQILDPAPAFHFYGKF